jgi:hypothetical protein
VTAIKEICFKHRLQNTRYGPLQQPVRDRGNRDWSLLPVLLGDLDSAQRLGLILAIPEPLMESLEVSRNAPFVFLVRDAVHSRAGFLS